MNEEKAFITIRVASTITGLHEQTLRKLHDGNVLAGYKTASNQRMFCRESVYEFCNMRTGKVVQERINILYSRVSSKKQENDLARQIDFLQNFRSAEESKCGKGEFIIISDIGSGINFKRKGIKTILDYCLQGIIGEVVIAHRDRLARFGFEIFKELITKAGGKPTVIDDQTNKSTEQELAEDLLSIVHIYSCRQMGKRSYSNQNRKNNAITRNKNEVDSRTEVDN